MNRIFFILLVFAGALEARAQEPSVSAQTDSAEYRVGDWIALHLDARLPAGVDSLTLAVKDSVGPFEILHVDPSAPAAEHQLWTLRLTNFDTGKVYIPPVAFTYHHRSDTTMHTAYSNPVFVSIVGIPFDAKGDIKDIKPPLDAPWKFEDFLPYLIALLVLACAALAYYYYRRWKKRKEESYVPLKPSIPPGQVALAALRELEDKHLWQQGKIKEFYSEATEIVRRFLENQYRVLALESTSDEIIEQLKRLPEAQMLMKEFRSFFTTADLVKFAKYLPAPEEHEHELRWAYEIVRGMLPHFEPAVTPEPAEEETADVR